MGKARRGGYLFLWWVGDHSPRHVHVFDSKGARLGRVAVDTGQPLDGWLPPQKVLHIIADLKKENRL